jgi:intracellular septation protein
MATRRMPTGLKPATEFGPLLIFFAAYYFGDLYLATGAIMVTTLISLAISYYYTKTLPTMPLVTAVVVMVFGGLTLYLEDETFIKMKPTIVNTMFAAILFAGLLFGKSFIKVLFDNFWNLDDIGWKKLTIRLAVFFLVMAVFNEIVWRNFSTDIWVNVKVFASPALTFVFFMAQVPFITKHTVEKTADTDE